MNETIIEQIREIVLNPKSRHFLLHRSIICQKIERIRSINSGLTILGCITSSYWKIIYHDSLKNSCLFCILTEKAFLKCYWKLLWNVKKYGDFHECKFFIFVSITTILITTNVTIPVIFIWATGRRSLFSEWSCFGKRKDLKKIYQKSISFHVISFYFSQKVFRSKHLFEPNFSSNYCNTKYSYEDKRLMVSINGKYNIVILH